MRVCIDCKKEFKPSSAHKRCPSCRSKRRRIPCPECGKPMTPGSAQCRSCRPMDGENNPSWKGGITLHSKRYVYVKAPEHPRAHGGYVLEHITVMEEYLGRYLFPEETVHHLYGIRDDNRIECLELWTKPQPSGIRAEDAIKWAKEIIEKYQTFVPPSPRST